MRNEDLTVCGRMLVLYQMLIDCKARGFPPAMALKKQAKEMKVNLDQFKEMTRNDMNEAIRQRKRDLWKAQKTCEGDRAEWLRTAAKEQAKAAVDQNRGRD